MGLGTPHLGHCHPIPIPQECEVAWLPVGSGDYLRPSWLWLLSFLPAPFQPHPSGAPPLVLGQTSLARLVLKDPLSPDCQLLRPSPSLQNHGLIARIFAVR